MNSSADTDVSNNLLIPSATILLVLSLIGIYGNACIIWATFKFRNFHSPGGILISLLAVGDVGHQFNHVPYSILIYSGITFISQRVCFWMQLIPAVCLLHSVIIIAFLGIDRLICVAKPVTYRRISSSKLSQFYYILALNIIPILYISFMIITSYTGMIMDPEKDTLCLVVAVFAGDAEQYWALTAAFCTSLTVVIYVFLWIIVWKMTSVLASIRGTLKSLTIILVITFFGWFLGIAMVFYLSARVDVNKNLRIGLISYAGMFINLAIAANYFVYRFFGTDYKKAFKKLWEPKTSFIATKVVPAIPAGKEKIEQPFGLKEEKEHSNEK